MVALVLIAIASGVIGLKMHKAVAKKHFQTQIDRLKERIVVAQQMAVAMEADWKSVWRKEGKEWVVETLCDEESSKKLSPLRLTAIEIQLNGKKVENLVFDFSSTGKVSPLGTLLFIQKEEKRKWDLQTLFSRSEGEKLPP